VAGQYPSFEKLFRIGEVMRYSGLSRQTVHNYTVLGLITERERTAGGHRLYPEQVFERIERIKELRKTRTLREIRRILSPDGGVRPGLVGSVSV
jgi:DNA-binding transcriptional MerR regulator